MNLFDTFTPWALFVDLGLISILLLIGQVLRAKIKLIQKMFIPPSLIAGLLGLAFGPNGLGWLPFSDQLGTYAGILIAVVFAALPFSSANAPLKEIVRTTGPMWAYAQLGMLLQWGIVGLFGLTVIKWIWPNLNDAFGVMFPTGFYGGHGTAAAIGAAFEGLGWEDARSLGMMTATVGVIFAIGIGLIFIKWATRNKQAAFISDFNDLPDELRSGMLPEEKRSSIGTETTSSISIDSLTFHVALVCVAALLGYLASRGVKLAYPKLELPVFSCAFVIGLIMKRIFDAVHISKYICPQTTVRIGSMSTDLLVAFGVASIKLSVIVNYALPLLVLIICGTLITMLITFYLGRRLSKTYWFERTIFAWGWWTGTMAMGIALLRIVDPKLASKAMDDYALAYLPIAPVEIILISLTPVLFVRGKGFWMVAGCLALSAVTILIAWLMKWFVPRKK
ncbi:MAG: sodium:glutamate symporter [Alistipes sp.]|nr:sodium:glutamate symporter [Alistipes sp.]